MHRKRGNITRKLESPNLVVEIDERENSIMLDKIQRKCLPLINNEPILTYDYSSHHDGIVISTLSTLSFYHLYETGNPREVIFHEDLGSIRSLKIQNCPHPLVATIKDNGFYLWEMKNRLMPLTKHLHFDANFLDFNWAYSDADIFAGCYDNGVVALWDLRSAEKPMCKFQVGSSSIKGLKWCPTDSRFLMTNICQKNLTIFDIRMARNLIHKSASSSPSGPIAAENAYKVISFDTKIEDFAWSMKSSGFWTLTNNRVCEHWKAHSVEPIFVEKLESPLTVANTDWKITRIRPSYDDTSILHQNEKNGVFKLLSTDKHDQYSFGKSKLTNLVGYNWRNPTYLPTNIQHSFIMVTKSGFVHITDFTTEDFNSFEESKNRINPPAKSRKKSKLSFANLKAVINEDTESNEHMSTAGPTKSISRSGVVGPVSFYSLLGEDITAVNNAPRDGTLDGIRIANVDRFGRQIVFEFLIPASETFSITTKNYSAFYTSYYKTDELVTFLRQGIPDRVWVLTVSFAAKYSQFWNPKFSIENKSSFHFDPDLKTQLIDDLMQVAKTSAPKRGHSGGSFLYQIARCFRKKSLRAWEKKNDKDKMNASLTSIKHSFDTVASLYSESDQDHDGGSVEFLKITEASAFKVPFPVISGGIFNNRGQLILFGNATLRAASPVDNDLTATCNIVSKIPQNIMTSPPVEAKGGAGTRHRSYAHLMVAMFKVQLNMKNSNGKSLTAASSNATLDRVTHGLHDVNSATEEKKSRTNTPNFMSNLKHEESTEGNDYDLSFTRGSKDFDNDAPDSENISRTSSNNGLADVLGRLPREIGALRDRRDSKDFMPLRHPSFQNNFVKEISTRVNADGKFESMDGTVTTVQPTPNYHEGKHLLCSIGTVATLLLAEEYRWSSTQPEVSPTQSSSSSLIDGVKRKIELCRYNATVVERLCPHNRKLIQFWKLLAVALEVSSVSDTGSIIHWNGSIIGSSLFVRLVEYLISAMDTQLWATVIAVLGDSTLILNLCATALAKKLPLIPNYFGKLNENLIKYLENQLYIYSDWLDRWGLILQSTEILKHINTSNLLKSDPLNRLLIVRVQQDEINLDIFCIFCQQKVQYEPIVRSTSSKNLENVSRGHQRLSLQSVKDDSNHRTVTMCGMSVRCYDCRKFGIYCTVCMLPVRGLCSVCEKCGHGGHEEHLQKWFDKNSECATGCGCFCRSIPNLDELTDDIKFEDDEYDSEGEILTRVPESQSESGMSGSETEGVEEEEGEDEMEELIRSNHGISTMTKMKKRTSSYHDSDMGSKHYFDDLLGNNSETEYTFNNFEF